MVGGVLLVFAKVFGLLSLGSIPSGSSNPRRFLFPFEGSFFLPLFYFIFLLYGPQVDIPPPPPPFFYSPFFLSTCRMAKGHEEVSTSQAGLRRGTVTPQKYPRIFIIILLYIFRV